MATDFVSLILKDREEKEKNRPAQSSFQDTIFNRSPDEMYYWRDASGNTNRSNLTTGETTRFRDIKGQDPNRAIARDSALADLGQSVGGALQRQGANYKSALATLGLGAAGLLHGDNNYQPEVGSWLWRLQEGAEADTGVANQLAEDSKYGRGALGRFTMDLTSGAVDLAGDQLLNLVAPGAGMAAMAARSFGGTAEEQREQGKSISTQFFKGLKSAAIEYGTEKFAGIGGRSIEGGGYIDNLLSRAEESIVRKGGNAFLTKLGFAFGSEAVEEMMSDWLNPLADKFLAGVVKGDYDIEDFPSFAEVAYDGLVGGALGLLGGTREGLQAQSRVRSMGGNQGYADFLAQERADTKAQVKNAKKAKRAQLKAIFDYATHHAEQAMDRAKNIKANQASQTPVEAQQPSTQQVTPEAAETPENTPSREFKSKPEAETDVPFTFGEETAPEAAAPAPEVAPAAEENPVVTEQPESATMEAEPEGVAVDASDFSDEAEPAPDAGNQRTTLNRLSLDELRAEYALAKESGDEARLREIEQFAAERNIQLEEAAPAAEEKPKTGADFLAEQAQRKTKPIGKKAGEQIAVAAYLADMARLRAAREADSAKRGVEVDTRSKWEIIKAKAEANKAKQQNGTESSETSPDTNAASETFGPSPLDRRLRGIKRKALGQNGIDYQNDPRPKYFNEELGEYNEIDITDGTHSEDEVAEYLADMRQIRILDAVDNWIEKQGAWILSGNYNAPNHAKSLSERYTILQKALNDYVRWYVSNGTDNGRFAMGLGESDNREKHNRVKEAGEASREVAQDKADEARLKGKKRTQKLTENGFTAVPIGNGLYRVTGPSGNTSLEVAAADAADAVQKYKDNLTEESRKAAKERKAKEAELKKMRDEVQESQENPAQIEGSDGKTYEVTKQLTKSENNYEYVVTELDEDGLPTDVEAEVYRKNASNEKEAVEYAIAHPQYFKDGSVEGEDWGEGSSDGETQRNISGRNERVDNASEDGRGREVLRRQVQSSTTQARTGAPELRINQGSTGKRTAGEHFEADEPLTALFKETLESEFGKGAKVVKVSGWRKALSYVLNGITGSDGMWASPGNDPAAAALHDNGTIFLTAADEEAHGPIVSLSDALHEATHERIFSQKDKLPGETRGERATYLLDKICERATKFDKRNLDVIREELGMLYSKDLPVSDSIRGDEEKLRIIVRDFLNEKGEFYGKVNNEIVARITSGGIYEYLPAGTIFREAEYLQQTSWDVMNELGLIDKSKLYLFPRPIDIAREKLGQEIDFRPELVNGSYKDELEKIAKSIDTQPELTNAKEYAYQKNLAGETDVDEESAKAAMPEDLDGLSERIKSSNNEFYGERKANITKAAEAISKNIGKDASTVLPEDLADFVGKDFSQASKDIDGFAKEFLTALATEDDGAALKTLADDLPKRIKKSKALKELLGDAETGNVAKMARVLAEAEDAKTAQNAASDLAEMIAKEAEEMPKRLKTLEQWDKNLSKRVVIARFLSGNKTVSQIASVYFGYQRDMINVLQGLDNFDKYGDGYGYKLAKKILDANFKSQTALGNSIDHVLAAQAEFEKSGGANKTVELKMLKKNQWESHQISLAEAVDFLHTIRTLQASKINAWQDITYRIGDQKLTISSLENFNRVLDTLTQAVRNDKAANAYYQSFTEGYAMFKDSSKEAIRDASGRTVDMFEDGTYYPISSAPNGQASAEHDYDFGLDSTRYMQRRVSESGGVIQIFDPAVRFNSYAHTAANLVARAATGAEVERLNRGGLGKSITSIVEERYGKGATDTVKQYIKDSSNFRQESDTASSLLRNLRLNIQGGALFGNFGSMLKQYPSVYNAAGVLDFDSITHGIISQMKAGNRSRAAELGSIKTRHQGNLDPSVAETLNENSGFKKAMEKLKILKFAKEGFEIVDSAAIRTIYLASEYQVEVKDNISRDSAEFNDRVMDYFIPAFLQTQPQFEKTLRPFVQTSDSELIRMFGMFKTQPLRNLNTMIRTISEYSTVKEKYGADSKEFKETEKQLRHTVAGQASASLMFGALGVLAKLLYHRRKDLEDKEGNLDAGKVMSRVLMNAAEASGGMLVFGDAAVQMVIDMASGGKTNEFYGLSAGAVSSVADALDAVTTFAEKPNAYNAKRAAGYISTLFGIPLNNAYAILNSAIMYGKDISGSNEGNYDDILKYLDAQAKAAKKEEEKAAKAAAKEAEKSGADMLADTAKQNASQSELNSQEEQKTTEVSTYLKKPYQALLDSGMSSEKSQDLLAFIDTDDNNSIKQAEMFAFYKDNPDYEQYVMAMWNAYGYKTSWESYKAKHK